MSAYTPGPWILKHISGSNFAVQRFEIRSGSEIPHPIFNKDTSAINGTSVCMSPQDANLISAAPELLEALVKFREAFVIAAGDKSPFCKFALAPVDEAIAKARGES